MMRQMRENTKWIMLVTALAFAALMVFEWGMDITGRSAGGIGEIGRVNGSPVLYDDYIATYRNLYDQVQRSQEAPVSSQQNKEIEDRAFEEVVTQVLIQQELERRGIVVADREIQQAAQFSPPPDFAGQPAFQTDGQFDFQKYQTFLATADEAFLLQLEAYYRDIIPRSKLLRQVSTGVFLTDAQLWQRWKDENETVRIRYIPMDPAQRIDDAEVSVSAAEVEAYYEENQEDFVEPARAQVRAVVLSKTPTPADTAASLARAEELRRAIVEDGEDFAEVARNESADEGTATAGGELGVFGPGRMVAPFDSAVFALPVDRISQPIQTSFGYHLIQVQERWAQDSVRARHILVPIARTDESEIELLTLADSLEELGEQRSLEEAAQALSLPVEESELTDAFAFLAGAGQVTEGADWAFEEAEVGDVSPVFETPQAFYALELISSSPGGTLPLASVRPTVEQILRLEKKQERARAQAGELVARIRSGEALDNVAATEGLDVRSAGPFSRNDFVPGLGRYTAAVGAAFGLEPGEVSDPVSTRQNTFVVELVDRTPADSLAWVGQKEAQRNELTQRLRQARLEEWLTGLREAARVVDRRDAVLQPVEEQPLRTGPFGF